MNANSHLLCVALLAAPALAKGDEPRKFVVHTVDGASHVGSIESWNLNEKLVLQSQAGQKVIIHSADLDDIDCPDSKRVPPSGSWQILLRDDGRWFADIAGGDEQSLIIRHPLADRQKIAIDGISSIARREGRTALLSPGDEDAALLINGDTARGSVVRFTSESVILAAGGNERALPWKAVAAVVLAPTDSRSSPPRTALVELTDASRFNVAKLDWRPAAVEVSPTGGPPISLQPQDITHIEIAGGRRTWLSKLAPRQYESKPFLDKKWPLRVDQNVMGGPLSVAGQVYRRGIGLHSACKATWNLSGKYQRFRAAVGIDDSAGSLADADVVISLDGRVVAEHRHLTAGQAPKPIDIDVGGAKDLTIEFGFGNLGHVQDRVDLVNAALISRGSTSQVGEVP